jgi:hypothetical protein
MKQKNFPALPVIIVAMAMLVSGCVLPSIPSISSLPSLPTIPALPSGTDPNQIVFPAGATTGVVEGTVQPGQTLEYYAWASANQPILAVVRSPNKDVTLSIVGEDQTILLDASQKSSFWSGTLPATQNYTFHVIGGASAETFKLLTTVMARVQFGEGQNSIQLSGQTPNGLIVSYAVFVKTGQTLTVSLNTSEAGLTIWGFADNQQFVQAKNGAKGFSFQAPSDQDYILDVVPAGGKAIHYKINIQVENQP